MRFIFDSQTIAADPTIATGQLGGKAQALAALSSQNLPIPDWFVLSPAAFEQVFEQVTEAITPSTLPSIQISPIAQAELTAALAQCSQGERVAVRSSACDEDGASHSFAGQLASFLFVDPVDVAAKAVAVGQSVFSDRVMAYRQEHQLSLSPSPPAVLIQKMVNADVAGVAFSAHPVTGQRGIAVVSAVYGLGTALVSGETDADVYQIDRQSQIVDRHIAHKQWADRWVNASMDKARSETIAPVAVNPSAVNQPALQDQQVQTIAALVRQVEAFFGCPQDIEWAIADGQIYLLQARPITTLVQTADPDGVLNLWDNSNIVESYGGITTPLTFSFARRAYEEVYRQFCRMMGVPAATIAQHDNTFRRMLGLVQGRIYYNLLSWYRVLALLPGFSINRRFMEQMMGVREELPAEILTDLKQAWRDKLQDGWRLVKTIAGLIKNYLTLSGQIRQFYQRLNHALSLPQSQLAAMRPDELAAHYRDLERQLLTRWDAPLVNDFFAMIFYGVLKKLTAAWCDDSEGTLQNDLISGEGGMISAEPARQVQQMAAIAARSPQLVESLISDSLSQIWQQIDAVADFKAKYQTYLEKFGDRCLEELKLESPTLHDNPLLLLRSIGHLASNSVEPHPVNPNPVAQSATATAIPATTPRQSAERRVSQALRRHPVRSILFGWVLKNARARVRDRENLRFERTRLFGRARRIFVELGKRLHAIDRLNSSRDVFYLEVAEVLGFVDGTATTTDLKGLVAVRQAEFDGYRQLPSPGDRFETRGIVHQGNSFQGRTATVIPAGDTLRGTGCCPGIIRAPVQVVTDPHKTQLRQGYILVAERTDPGWIMLFPAAAGLLVERGSLLSHSAIVAREMGIPAIVSLPGVTHWLKDGDWVELDGSTGIVRRLPLETETAVSPSLQEVTNG